MSSLSVPSDALTRFRFYFSVVYKLPNASSPEHISLVFTGRDARRGRSFELCFEFSRTPHWLKEWFITCCFVARLSASRCRCGSTCWNGVTRSCAGSSIISMGAILTSLSWCSSQTQVGHGSLGATPDATWEDSFDGALRWLPAVMCVLRDGGTDCDVLIKRVASAVVKYTSASSPS